MITIIGLIVFIIAAVVVVRIVRILELSNELADEDEDLITSKDNRLNGILMILFLVLGMAGMLYFTLDAKKYLLPEPASIHGKLTDDYLNFNFELIAVVFVICQILLFGFANKYRHRKGEKAYFLPVHHKLEIIWTVIPSIVLIGLIVYGLKLWGGITATPPKDSMVIEVYGQQFKWTSRYSGGDNKLGGYSFKLITGENPLGIVRDSASADDRLSSELHLPLNGNIFLKLRSQDVIHSAYLPHFRAQMNCVPGMVTQIFFVPTKTTAEMRAITKDPKFDYVLLCNKVCGVSHFMMEMKVVVDTPEDFMKWYKDQKLVFETAPATQDTIKKMADQSSAGNKIVAAK